MPKKSHNHDNHELLIDDGKWDDIDDDRFADDDDGAGAGDLRLNVQARRLYDRYQEERRLRELLGDDFDF